MTTLRKVILFIAVSLDGYIARKDGSLDWLLPFQSSHEDYGYADFMKTVDTVIMGRKTYDAVASMGYEFPHEEKQCFIVTRSPVSPKKHLIFFDKGLIPLVNELQNHNGKSIFVDGGAEIVNELMKHHLFDEYIISVIPRLLGDGIRLFNDARPQEGIYLIQSKSYPNGLVQLHYAAIR